MALRNADQNTRSDYDELIAAIANYVHDTQTFSDLAYKTARYCLMDSLACMFLALQYPACTKLLGPIIPGTTVPLGVRVPGTSFELDPILAAFNIGALVRWLDFNDTWLAAEWGHPSDNLGAILACADYKSRLDAEAGINRLSMKDVLNAMIKAHEIQGILALENGFNRLGFDHVILVRIAGTAIAAKLLGADIEQTMAAISQAFLDGAALRTYRHAPNTGSRKSWAAGDATSRALRLAWLTMQGEMGYPSALSAKNWGFNDVILKKGTLKQSRSFKDYVMENVLFKIAFPAEFHAQTAVECAIILHPQVTAKLDEIEKIEITTQESAVRIISKTGPLYNPADRDHCLQYMVAAALLKGDLRAEYYEDEFAKNPDIDRLRDKMLVIEDAQFSKDYLDPDKRSIANALKIYFKDGTATEKVIVEYPIGHKNRREEGYPLMFKKFENAAQQLYSDQEVKDLLALFHDQDQLQVMPVHVFMSLLKK